MTKITLNVEINRGYVVLRSGEKVAIIPRANFDWVSAIRSGLRQKRKRPSTRKKLADD